MLSRAVHCTYAGRRRRGCSCLTSGLFLLHGPGQARATITTHTITTSKGLSLPPRRPGLGGAFRLYAGDPASAGCRFPRRWCLTAFPFDGK